MTTIFFIFVFISIRIVANDFGPTHYYAPRDSRTAIPIIAMLETHFGTLATNTKNAYAYMIYSIMVFIRTLVLGLLQQCSRRNTNNIYYRLNIIV